MDLLWIFATTIAATLITLSESKTLTVCEHGTMKLSCPTSHIIIINDAGYGRMERSTCRGNGRYLSNTNCKASSSKGVMQRNCNGRPSCSVKASNGVFGDPCRGTYKYLTVAYMCVPKPEIFTGTFENHQYDLKGKNNWHYVTITYDPRARAYKWKNRAGRVWTLTSRTYNSLNVQPDCPYYRSGHKVAVFNPNGVYGPWREFYTRKKSEPIRTTACEHRNIQLRCPTHYKIRILFGSYGRWDRTTCRHRAMSNIMCDAKNGESTVRRYCDGKQSCVVPATNRVFGDPCWGTYKYLSVTHICV